jgi:predicted  nucleic acid-binding Zn-ribbon protein
MAQDPFIAFVRFIESDRALRQAQQEYAHAQKEREGLLDRETQELNRLNELKNTTASLFRQMNLYELDAKTNRERKQEIARRLDIVNNVKEYTALQHELEELDRTEVRCEEQLFATWQAYENSQAQYQKEHALFELWLAEHRRLLDQATHTITQLEHKIQELEKERAQLEHEVKPEFLQEYYQLKQSFVDPIVPVIDNYCSACKYQVPLRDLALLRRHVFVSCQECYRKLYLL